MKKKVLRQIAADEIVPNSVDQRADRATTILRFTHTKKKGWDRS